ncbi:hypothetical protein [Ulvibacter litoralis]|uniref:VanZ like family protein n=1 Tax=Ulvibacter litoralis TaxID=227084 RepID=A0A1G7H358_9FLAO|nr:hypothetical protein [Ulvibacter litoralis]GHC59111.1 hypothetical protein GCM10008083_24840 [Ulvibacter litoralis]SDE94589.1 hypothetical protein SAMN05421855_103488 [Ulvibacter litoralis]
MEKKLKSLKYLPKIWAAIGYLTILIFSFVLFFGRNIQTIRIEFLFVNLPGFYTHVSNFSLSLIIFVTIGYIGLMMGSTLKHLTMIGVIIGLINLVIEFFISILNTADKIDAVYGVFGVFLGLIFLFSIQKWGLNKNEL